MDDEESQTTIEQAKVIYQYYHNLVIKNKTGSLPRPVKDWNKVFQKPEWPYILRFAHNVNNSGGQINYKIYIQALFDFSNNQWFTPKLFVSQKGIQIYKHYLKTINDNQDSELVRKGIVKSIKYVASFCKKHNLKDFRSYFNFNATTFPTIVIHYTAGSITKAFFTMIPYIEKRIKSFPPDIVADYFSEQDIKDFPINRALYANLSEKLENIAENFEEILNYYIQKDQE